MRFTVKTTFLCALLIFITSCSTISYTPKVSLDVSPKTINKKVQVDKFVDLTTMSDKKNPFGGVSVTNAESLSNDLDIEVTNAIVTDFSNNGVFQHVSRRIENPDYIIKGEIVKFSGKSEMNDFAKISWGLAMASIVIAPIVKNAKFYFGTIPLYSCYLGLPVSRNTSEIEIIIRLYDKNKSLIGTYTGKSNDIISTSMYKNKMLAVPTMTNKAFSAAVMQIRDQILNDMNKFENR